jgi:hypothetical protein
MLEVPRRSAVGLTAALSDSSRFVVPVFEVLAISREGTRRPASG